MSHYVNLLTYLLLSCLITSILSFRNPHQRSNLLPHINQIDKNNPIDFNYDQLIEKVKKNIPSGSTIVIKYGGHAMENQDLKESFCKDIGTLCGLGIIPIIVHGGGPQIQKMLTRLGIESKFINGLRVTDSQTIEIAQMILCGSINKEIVSMISKQPNTRGAIGLSGLDSGIIKAKKIEKYDINPITNEKFKIDLGLVGEPYEINTSILNDFRKLKLVPVIAPIGCDDDGNSLNINADTSAGAVAESLKADRLLLLTDIVGVLDKNKNLIEKIHSDDFSSLIVDGTISGGMIPKVETAVQSALKGVKIVSIMDGREQHSVLRSLSGEVFGTQILSSQ